MTVTRKGDRIFSGEDRLKVRRSAPSTIPIEASSCNAQGSVGKSVFLVDDDFDLRNILKDIFEMYNFRVIEAATCSEAMRKFDSEVDIAIVDYHLPDGNGIALLGLIRNTRPHLPVIIMTGYGTEEIAIRAFRTGAADYIKKPLDIEFLLRIIDERLGGGIIIDKSVAGKTDSGAGLIMEWMAMYIEENHTFDLDLKKLAEKAGMSKFRFCRLFKEKFGKGYLSYLNGVRVAHAKELLRNHTLNILNISEHTGFGSLSQFERVFREIEGISPREYRKKMMQDKG